MIYPCDGENNFNVYYLNCMKRDFTYIKDNKTTGI